MAPLFRKLQLAKFHTEIFVVNPPESFEAELKALAGISVVRDPGQIKRIAFAVAFVQRLADVEAVATSWLPKVVDDAVVWLCYPKQSSKRYKCDFNRDTGWASVKAKGFDTVRAVAIDEDWSALRFRRVEFIGK